VHRRDTHQEQGADEDRLAPDPVAEIAADDPAERAHRETDAQRGEGQQRARQRVVRGEEGGVEVQRRGDAEADEVVGLDRRPDGAPDGDLLLGRGALDRVPGGDLFEVGIADGGLPIGHGDLRGAGDGDQWPLIVDC
jgi:hypothetical protein